MYEELMQRISDAYELMLRDGIKANTVIINGKKYGRLIDWVFPAKDVFLVPSVFGLAIEVANLPDDFDFVVQYRHDPPRSLYDAVVEENNALKEKLAKLQAILNDD